MTGRKDPLHTSVCDRCYQGTWYDTEQPCKRERQQSCKCCGQGIGYGPCGGTLHVIDRSELASQFARYYESGDRVRVRFGWAKDDADGGELTGTVSKTTGWRPSYMLMRTARSMGSSDLLGADDKVIAIKRGRKYMAVHP